MMASIPAVSVLLTTYNRATALGSTLRALRDQSFDDFEVLIGDDCSTDGTREAVLAEPDPRFVYVRHPTNLGLTQNMRALHARSRGHYVQMMHDHDHFGSGLIAGLASLLDRHPSAGFVHPLVLVESADGNHTRGTPDFPELTPGAEFLHRLFSRRTFAFPVTGCSMTRRSAVERAGGFLDPAFGYLSDIDLWLRLARVGDVAFASEVPLVLTPRNVGDEFAAPSWEQDAWLRRAFGRQVGMAERWCDSPQDIATFRRNWRRTSINNAVRTSLRFIKRGRPLKALGVARALREIL